MLTVIDRSLETYVVTRRSPLSGLRHLRSKDPLAVLRQRWGTGVVRGGLFPVVQSITGCFP